VRKLVILLALGVLTLFGGATSAGATTLGHHPLYMPNASNMTNPTLQPPPVCCAPTGPPVAGEPAPVNMAYFGGHVQVTPVISSSSGAGDRPARSTTQRPGCLRTTPTERRHG